VQPESGVCRQAHYIAGVWRYLGFKKDYVHHREAYFGSLAWKVEQAVVFQGRQVLVPDGM
jgi:hypothetical protein